MSDRYEGGVDKVLGRKVAVRKFEGKLAIERLKDASSLSHPSIVTILDLGADYVVYEHVEGSTMRDRLAHGPIAPGEIAKIATELGNALSAIHDSGLFHGDVRPDNVILSKTGAKLAAFGLAEEGSAVGDQRGLANTIYEAFSGKKPSEPPRKLADDAEDIRARVLRARVDAALARAFGSNPYPSCRELGTTIAGAIDPPYSGAFPALRQAELEAFSHSASIVPKPTRRLQNILAGVAVILIALLIAFGHRRQERTDPPIVDASADAGHDAK
jgi:serine/threonine-protein kinase